MSRQSHEYRCPVPSEVGSESDIVTVERAWPGSRGLTFAGVDQRGRVRAGSISEGPGAQATVAPYAVDPKLPGLEDAVEGGKLVVHRLGRRAVVATGTSYLKILKRDVADQLDVAQRASELGRQVGFRVPEATRVGSHAISTTALAGSSAYELGQSTQAQTWRSLWQAWAKGWEELAKLSPGDLPVHDTNAETAVVEQWTDRAARHGALNPQLLERSLTRVRRELAATNPAGGLRVCHRDLHDKQILFHADTESAPDQLDLVGLLDFDTLAAGDPALDLANLIEHASLRAAQRKWSQDTADAVVDVVLEVAGRVDVTLGRLAAYRRASLLRLACVYAFRPRWHSLAVQLLERAADEDFLICASSMNNEPLAGWRA